MPRNSSGTYTLPVSSYVSGTVIKSADMNSNLSDIATALTTSVASTGVTAMTGPLKLANGSSGAPSLTFAGETTTGFYWSAAGTIVYVVSGSAVFTASASGLTLNTGTLTASGNASVTGTFAVTSTSTFTGTITLNGTPGSIITTEDFTLSAVDPAAPAANRLRYYSKADALANGNRPYAIDSNGTTMPLLFQGGQCRMTFSGGKLVLTPYMGNRLTINGVPQIIPDAGISLAASNTAATFVYIYAYMSAGTMTMEMSTTVPTAQAGTSIQQKTGDPTRTLVGAAYTDTGGAWADTEGKLWVLSYFNRKRKVSRYNPNLGTLATFSTNTGLTELSSSFRNNFISWSDETPEGTISLTAYCSGANTYAQIAIAVDGSIGNTAVNVPGFNLVNNLYSQTYTNGVFTGLTENTTHYASIYVISSTQALRIAQASTGTNPNTWSTIYVMG